MKTEHEYLQMVRQRSAGPELSAIIMESLSRKPNVSFSILKVIFRTVLISNFSKNSRISYCKLKSNRTFKLYSKETKNLYKSTSLLPKRLGYISYPSCGKSA